MVEKQGLNGALQQIGQVIPPPQMSQFMREQSFQLTRGEAGQHAGGKEHHGLERADHQRCHDPGRLEHAHHAAQAQPQPGLLERLFNVLANSTEAAGAQNMQRPNPGEVAQHDEAHPCHPGRDGPRQATPEPDPP